MVSNVTLSQAEKNCQYLSIECLSEQVTDRHKYFSIHLDTENTIYTDRIRVETSAN